MSDPIELEFGYPDPNLIASLSGHVEGSRAFRRYRTIDDDMKRKLVEMIN